MKIMRNIRFVPGTSIHMEIATQHSFNAISEAIYIACKYMIEVQLHINECVLVIDCNSNPFQKELEYKEYVAQNAQQMEITIKK